MKISPPRRAIYKQEIKGLMIAKPGINNSELAVEIGIHRNTVTKLLEEIRIENEIWVRERWKMLLNDVTVDTQLQIKELGKLWHDSYPSLHYSRPSQLVSISKMRWVLLKDLYRMHLEYMGIRQTPNALLQVNINTKS
ncbi:MAG: hypothetical protein WBO77_03970 [Microgenomates group bacterium]